MTSSLFEQIFKIVCCIPAGQVATYGQVARLAGVPRGARTVGWALRAMPEDSDVPWQRVINAQGSLSLDPHGNAIQRALLEAEGVVFGPEGRVDLRLYGWAGLEPAEREQILSSEP